MKINILVNEVFNGWEPTDTRLGGTEESVVNWAEWLTKFGHEVTVYRNGLLGVPVVTQGSVHYVERDGYEGGGDICLNVKSSDVAPKEPTIYFTNETDAAHRDLSHYLGVIWPSQWAADNIEVNNSNLFVVPHGYDPMRIFPSAEKI